MPKRILYLLSSIEQFVSLALEIPRGELSIKHAFTFIVLFSNDILRLEKVEGSYVIITGSTLLVTPFCFCILDHCGGCSHS